MFGIHCRSNVFYCALTGGVFILMCDIASRYFFKPVGIPVGIITSFIGIPFFIYLLWKKNYKFG
jgi:iron complex transport system permease protein